MRESDFLPSKGGHGALQGESRGKQYMPQGRFVFGSPGEIATANLKKGSYP